MSLWELQSDYKKISCASTSEFNLSNISKFIVCLLFIFLATASTSTATTSTIVLGDDGCADAFDFLVFLLHFLCICLRIRIHPRLSILQCIHDLLLLFIIELLAESLVL